MKKVGLYLYCTVSWGGTFQYSLSLLQSLKKLEDEGFLSLTVLYEDDSWIELLKKNSITNAQRASYRSKHSSSMRLKKYFSLSLWRYLTPLFDPVVRLIMAAKCDYWFFPSQEEVSYQGPYKSIVSIHDLMHRYESRFEEVGNSVEFEQREKNYKNICKYSYKILVDSVVGKNHVMESYGEDLENKIEVLYYIIPDYLESIQIDSHTYDKYKINSEYLFYPAQFWKHKNHHNLILAFNEVKKNHPGLKLVLTGGKQNGYSDILNQIRELHLENDVILPGYVTEGEMVALYKKAKALVMPTFFGPTNIPPLEALYFGTPVVYSKIYAYGEFLKDKAYFVDPLNYKDIAMGIENVFTKKIDATYNVEIEKLEFTNTLRKILS